MGYQKKTVKKRRKWITVLVPIYEDMGPGAAASKMKRGGKNE